MCTFSEIYHDIFCEHTLLVFRLNRENNHKILSLNKKLFDNEGPRYSEPSQDFLTMHRCS